MTRAERRRLKWTVTGGGILWILLVGFLMLITLPEGAVEHHASSTVKDRMADCAGTFKERFDCKEQIIVESGRETFFILAGRFLLVILPPLVASFRLSSYLRRHPLEVEQHHVHDGDWKARAQMHTEVQTPEEAALALHMAPDELPHPHSRAQLHVDDIAPAEDWKVRADLASRGKTKQPS